MGYDNGTGSATISADSADKSITILLGKKKADVGVDAKSINGTVYRGSTIMVSADVIGDPTIDFTPTNPLTVKMTAARNSSSVFDTQTKTIICPKNESNLVWFEVDIPESGYTSADVTFTFDVSAPDDIAETSTVNNTSTKTATTYVLPERQSPDASFELDAPSSFSYSNFSTSSTPELSWSVWEWNSGFVKKTYTAKLTVSAELTPDASAGYRKQNGSTWTTRSGYGLNTSLTADVSTTSFDCITGNTKTNAYYPEHNYSDTASLSDMLELVGGKFVFKQNGDSIGNKRYHATPIWFPNKTYSVKYYVYDKWCPAGMLTGETYASVMIEGSMYDDLYTN